MGERRRVDNLLTNEELCAAAQNGDEEAGNLLIEQNAGFIVMTVRSVLGLFGIRPWEIGLTYDDLLEEGRIGMWKSIAKYDPESGANFLTYAKPAIRHTVIDLIRRQRQDMEALSDRITVETLETRYSEGQRYTVWDDLAEMPDIVGDPFHQSPEQIYMEKELIERLYRALSDVGERSGTYLCYRFGFDDGDEHSVRETAEHFTLTETIAKSVERTALAEMRREMAG